MYDNVGTKIKNLAIGTFVVETIVSILGGIVLSAEISIAIGLPVIFMGFITAWLSSWLLYGFGELICETSSVKRELVELNKIISKTIKDKAKETNRQAINNTPTVVGPNTPYYCKQCGNPGPYEGACPNCGSTEVTFHSTRDTTR